jgi:hypothetical protein
VLVRSIRTSGRCLSRRAATPPNGNRSATLTSVGHRRRPGTVRRRISVRPCRARLVRATCRAACGCQDGATLFGASICALSTKLSALGIGPYRVAMPSCRPAREAPIATHGDHRWLLLGQVRWRSVATRGIVVDVILARGTHRRPARGTLDLARSRNEHHPRLASLDRAPSRRFGTVRCFAPPRLCDAGYGPTCGALSRQRACCGGGRWPERSSGAVRAR